MNRLFRLAVLSWLVGAIGVCQASDTTGSVRPLAPWAMTTIRAEPEPAETFTLPRNLVEIVHGMDRLDWQPNYYPKSDTLLELAKNIVVRRQVWNLEFSFKPIRMMYVDVPTANATVERKQVWYMVYRVSNPGFHQNPEPQDDKWGHEIFAVSRVNHTVRFFPRFDLHSLDQNKAYRESVLPHALERIAAVEMPGGKLLNSVEISEVKLQVSTPEEDHSVWGLAMWVDVDPRTDFFTVQVQGLSNAYQWEDLAGAYKRGDPPGAGRKLTRKTLQLNFWRPGDAIRLNEREIQFGLPSIQDVQGAGIEDELDLLKLFGMRSPMDYQWVYRP